MKFGYLRAVATAAAITTLAPLGAMAQNTIGWSFAANTPASFLGATALDGYFQMGGQVVNTVGGNTYLYIIGGNVNKAGQPTYSGAGDSPYIYYAPIDSNGVVGTWTQATHVLPEVAAGEPAWAYIEQGVTSLNGRIYIYGRNNNGAPPQANEINIFTPLANGDINTTATTIAGDTGEADAIFTSIAADRVNSRIYSLNGGPTTAINVRDVNTTDGLLSARRSAGTLLTAVRQTPILVHNGRLYVIGGRGATMQSAVQYASIDAGTGSLGTFQNTTAALPTVFADGGAVSFNNTIYVIGGTRNGNPDTQNRVFRAVFGTNGDVTSWVDDATFPIPNVSQHTLFDGATPTTVGPRRTGATASATHIYLVGGRYDSTRISAQVAVGAILPPVLAAESWTLFD